MAETPKQDLAAQVVKSHPQILRQARRMLRGSVDAEDAAQDAMVAALRHVHEFRGDARLPTWLYRVGANAVLMGLRRDKRAENRTQRAISTLPVSTSWLHGAWQTDSPPTQLEAQERAQLLHWAVEQLPEHYRCVVMLCDLDERPVEEVAQSLGLTVGGVRTRRLRAHRLLRTTLSEQIP